jgi:hypothetical protein
LKPGWVGLPPWCSQENVDPEGITKTVVNVPCVMFLQLDASVVLIVLLIVLLILILTMSASDNCVNLSCFVMISRLLMHQRRLFRAATPHFCHLDSAVLDLDHFAGPEMLSRRLGERSMFL